MSAGDEDHRFVTCCNCGGDGGWDEAYLGSDHAVHYHSSKCTTCGGRGEYEIELEPITAEDLDEVFG